VAETCPRLSFACATSIGQSQYSSVSRRPVGHPRHFVRARIKCPSCATSRVDSMSLAKPATMTTGTRRSSPMPCMVLESVQTKLSRRNRLRCGKRFQTVIDYTSPYWPPHDEPTHRSARRRRVNSISLKFGAISIRTSEENAPTSATRSRRSLRIRLQNPDSI
jgi:hypothetical protein